MLRLPVAGGPGDVALQDGDVLVLATKTQSTAAALREWAVAPVRGGDTAGERLPVLCAQNGVEDERLAARWCATVLAACVWLPATHLRPGEVVASCAPLSGTLQVGCYPRGLDDAVRRVVAALDAVCREGEDWSDLSEAVTAEGTAVLDRLGPSWTSREEERAARGDRVAATGVAGERRGGGSTWQSLARGVETEVEHLNGEVALLGRESGVPTPLNAALVHLVTSGQREGRGPRWLDPASCAASCRPGREPDVRWSHTVQRTEVPLTGSGRRALDAAAVRTGRVSGGRVSGGRRPGPCGPAPPAPR